jgi:hypothetical protein
MLPVEELVRAHPQGLSDLIFRKHANEPTFSPLWSFAPSRYHPDRETITNCENVKGTR